LSDVTRACVLALWLALLTSAGVGGFTGSALAQLDGMKIAALSSGDELKSQRQRSLIADIARRELGASFGVSPEGDIRLLQRLLDEREVRPDQVFEQQAMGVVLGDAMVAGLRLRWVAVDDQYGHSRALRFRDTEHLFFPVTMISKRVRLGDPVDVAALYRDIQRRVEVLEAQTR